MRDVVKTNVKRQQSSKRQHRRSRLQPVYFLLVIVLVIGIGAALSMTLFFNVTDIVVTNETDAADEEIVRLSGIHYQDNLMRLDTSAAERAITSAVVYAENVKVKKHFPSTVEIEVHKAVPVANISCSYGYLLVSSAGRILEMLNAPREGLLIVTGYNPAVSAPGEQIMSEDIRLDTALKTMTSAVAACETDKIVSVDMRDQSDILVQLGEHITFHMGNSNDAVYKLKLALATSEQEQVNPGKDYRFTMVGNNQISVIPEEAPVQTTAPAPETTAPAETSTTETITELP